MSEETATSSAIRDDRGRPLAEGDRVVATATDDGCPLWANRGTVIGFGRTRVRVQWDSFGYDDTFRFHATSGAVLRRLTERD